MKTILVSGVCGFIASNLTKELIKKGYRIVGVDNLQTGKLDNIKELMFDNPQFQFIKSNVNETPLECLIDERIDYIFHYAACVGVERTLSKPLEVLSDIEGFKNVLTFAIDRNVKQVFYSSSSEVYGEPVEVPLNEHTTPLNSRLTYAVVKNIGEVMLKAYNKEFNLNYTIFRFFNTYGKNQSTKFVISKFIERAVNGEDITVYGDGMQTRTFTNISDNVKATINAIDNPKALNQTINIGGDNEITMNELAETVIRVTKSNSRIVHLPALKEGDMTRRVPDNRLMKEILGIDTLIPLEQGLKTLL
jgi:UDP-glucose 4-epimerase